MDNNEIKETEEICKSLKFLLTSYLDFVERQDRNKNYELSTNMIHLAIFRNRGSALYELINSDIFSDKNIKSFIHLVMEGQYNAHSLDQFTEIITKENKDN